jgi:membrane fusion protein (multidrug efflux system)
VRIAPRIAGRALAVPVVHFQHVRRGDLLVQIDPEPFQVALDQAQAQLANVSTQVNALESAVTAAEAAVVQARAQLRNAETNAQRARALVKTGDAPRARLDDAMAALRTNRGALAAAQARVAQAQNELGQAGADNAQVKSALARVEMARLNLSYTRIVAPADGVLGDVQVRPGAMVAVGEALFPLVEDGSFWIAANFKETDLRHIRSGQPAKIEIDISDHTYHGVVGSISPASGVAFSLLPPENATGNWVKVTQRFPVKIVPTDADRVAVPWSPWRVGASTSVTVDTTRVVEGGAKREPEHAPAPTPPDLPLSGTQIAPGARRG